MSRVKEQLLYAEEDAESAAWAASTDARAEWARAGQMVAEGEAERAQQELAWATRHPAEWGEWCRLSSLLIPSFDFGVGTWFDFPAFLSEVGPRPSARHAIERRDETRRYDRGNLTWSKQQTVRAEKPAVESPYLTADEAAAYCRRARKTLLNHHSLGDVRSMPGTRPPLFRREELDNWLSARRRPGRK